MKYIPYLPYAIILLLTIALGIATYVAVQEKPDIKVTETTKNYTTTTPVVTKIIQNNVPADIETLYVDGHNYEVANYHAEVDTNKVHIGLDVRYDERTNLFDIRHNIIATRDSIYHETIMERTITTGPRFLRFTGAIGVGIEKSKASGNYNLAGGDIAFGVKLLDSYSVLPFVAIRNDQVPLYGVRFGVDF